MLAFVRERIQWLVDNRVRHNVSAHDFACEITNLHNLLVWVLGDKIKVVHLALSMPGVPVFIHLSYIKLYDDYVNSYLILLVVLVLILDINNIVKELLN